MLPQNIFVTLYQIILLWGRFEKSSTAATLCCNHQSRLNKGRMVGFHKLHLTMFQAGDAVKDIRLGKNLTLTTAM